MPEQASPAPDAPEHLSRLYRLAQALTGDAERAARLAAATYRRAAATGVASPDRLTLFRLMVEHAGEIRAQRGTADGIQRDIPATGTGTLRGLRARTTLRVLDRVLPAAFLGLPAEARLLLTLSAVEECSCADAGRIVGHSPDETYRRLDNARTVLRQRLRENARPAERALLDDLSEDALRTALRRMAAAEFASPPPALEQTAAVSPSTPHALPAGSTEQAAGHTHNDHESLVHRLRSTLVVLLIIGAAGATGYLAQRLLTTPPETNVLRLSAQRAGRPRLTLQTSQPAAAARFIRNHLGQRLSIPEIEQATLRNVRIVEVTPGARVPVLRYEDTAGGAPLTIYAYSYALLDRHEERLHLDADILRTLAEARRAESHRIDGRAVLIWRNRDDIFVAVTDGNPGALRERLPF